MGIVCCLLRVSMFPNHIGTLLSSLLHMSSIVSRAAFHLLYLDKVLFNIMSRVFGCTCFVKIKNPKKNKLNDKVIQYIFVGYSSQCKGYRCYDLSFRCLFHTMVVTFLEETPDKTNMQEIYFCFHSCILMPFFEESSLIAPKPLQVSSCRPQQHNHTIAN